MKARKIFVITISLVSSIFFAGCSSHQTKKLYEKPVKQEASMRIRGMVKMLDTVKSTDQNSIQINQNVFEGLYRYDKKGHLVLAGAKSEKTEDGGKVRIYRLRKDARWSNGDPVVAQDYVYAWKKLLSLKESTSNWTNLLILKNAEEIHDGQKDMESLGVQALDDHTLRVELKETSLIIRKFSQALRCFRKIMQLPKSTAMTMERHPKALYLTGRLRSRE